MDVDTDSFSENKHVFAISRNVDNFSGFSAKYDFPVINILLTVSNIFPRECLFFSKRLGKHGIITMIASEMAPFFFTNAFIVSRMSS